MVVEGTRNGTLETTVLSKFRLSWFVIVFVVALGRRCFVTCRTSAEETLCCNSLGNGTGNGTAFSSSLIPKAIIVRRTARGEEEKERGVEMSLRKTK